MPIVTEATPTGKRAMGQSSRRLFGASPAGAERRRDVLPAAMPTGWRATRTKPLPTTPRRFDSTRNTPTRTIGVPMPTEIDGEYDKAIADFTAAIRLNPKDANLYRSRSGTYGKSWSTGEGRRRCRRGASGLTRAWVGCRLFVDRIGRWGCCRNLQLSPQQKKKLTNFPPGIWPRGRIPERPCQAVAETPRAQRGRGWRSSPARTRNRRGKRQARRWRRSSVRSNWNFTRHGSSRTSPARMLRFPEFLKMIAATLEQKEQFAKIQQQEERQTQEQWRRRYDRMLAVLSPRQQEKLRAESSARGRRGGEPGPRLRRTAQRFSAGRSKMPIR